SLCSSPGGNRGWLWAGSGSLARWCPSSAWCRLANKPGPTVTRICLISDCLSPSSGEWRNGGGRNLGAAEMPKVSQETPEKVSGPNLPAIVVASILGAVLLGLTSVQLRYWKNTRTLFEHAAKVTRENYVAVSILGSVLAREGKLDEASELFRKALRWKPGY